MDPNETPTEPTNIPVTDTTDAPEPAMIPLANDQANQPKTSVKDVTYDGYTFKIDTDVIDDVDNVDLVDQIENEKNLKAIVEFLEKLLGTQGYQDLKAYFVAKDGRFKLSKLGELYQAIFEQFDPKG